MTRHTTSIKRLAKLAVLIPLELAFRILVHLTDRPNAPSREWSEDDDRTRGSEW